MSATTTPMMSMKTAPPAALRCMVGLWPSFCGALMAYESTTASEPCTVRT